MNNVTRIAAALVASVTEKPVNPQRCENCKFSRLDQLPPPDLGKQRLCLLLPPVPCMAFGQQGRNVLPIGGVNMRPQVQDSDFCFQWQENPDFAPKLQLEN